MCLLTRSHVHMPIKYNFYSWTCLYICMWTFHECYIFLYFCYFTTDFFLKILLARYGIPDSKVHGANMGPNWVLSATDPRNLAIRDNKEEHRSASRTICTSDWIHCIAWITLPNLHVILHHGNHTASYILECSISRPATRWFLFQVGQSCCCQCSEDIVIDRGKIWD